jgi:predicted thioesterase
MTTSTGSGAAAEDRFAALVGRSHTLRHTVSEADLARRWGNGLDVLATPVLLWLGEMACMRLLEEATSPDEMSVGVAHDSAHLAPTVLGEEVTVTAVLVRASGRKCAFEVTARDPRDRVLSGTHTRAVVDRARFAERLPRAAAADPPPR